MLRNRHFLLVDLVSLPPIAYLSFALRLDDPSLGRYLDAWALLAALSLVAFPSVFYLAGLYTRLWRYAALDDFAALAAGVVGGVALTTALHYAASLVTRTASPALPHTVPGIFALLALCTTAGPRLASRLPALTARRGRHMADREPALVIGAGETGAMVMRALQHNPQLGLRVVGFLDDDAAMLHQHIRGVRVLGPRVALAEAAARTGATRAIIAMPGAAGPTLRETVALCEQAGVRPQIVPGFFELLDGSIQVSPVRDVQIEDLLRRAPISTDLDAVRATLRGKRVLITGAGGSIGSELCRQVLRCHPAEIILLGRGENAIFTIHNELTRLARAQVGAEGGGFTARLHPVIADVRFPERLRDVFARYRPEIVFHAAAHKHVPLMELNPTEAVVNNIFGTRNVLDAALAGDVERFVLISTDKAVNPANLMGASKRTAELLVHRAARRSGKPYVVVRFGNVLGSRGSVVPAMREQIARGGPVTVTDPAITRYFMSIPEAVQLVLQAILLGAGGEVFVFDMGEPVRIADLAADLIRLSGLQPGRDIEIAYTGLRPGEKLYEELFVAGERYERTRHEQIYIAANASNTEAPALDVALATLETIAGSGDLGAIMAALRALIPEIRAGAPIGPVRRAADPRTGPGERQGRRVRHESAAVPLPERRGDG